MAQPSAICRLAKITDRNGILNISKHVYGGRDYLDAYIDYFLSLKSGYRNSVIDIEGEVVAYNCGTLLDDGAAAVFRAGRVNDKFTGMGLARGVRLHLLDHFKGDACNLQYLASTANDTNPMTKKPDFKKKFKMTDDRKILSYGFRPADISSQRLEQDVAKLNEIQLKILLEDTETCANLFPAERAIVDWVPFKLTPGNARLMLSHTNAGYISTSMSDKPTVSMLSFSSYFMCRLGLAYSVDLYGSDVSDVEKQTIFHIAQAAQLATTQVCDKVNFCMFVSLDHDETCIGDIMRRLSIPRIKGVYDRLFAFEVGL